MTGEGKVSGPKLGFAAVPSNITLVSVDASGTDFATLRSTVSVTGGQTLVSLTMSVKSGTSRTFIGRGYDTANTLLYSGTVTGVTLPVDGSATVNLALSSFLGARVPTATTIVATSIGTTIVSFNATINPNGFQTAYYFQFGTSSSYGSTTPVTQLSSFTTLQSIVLAVSGLLHSTTYYYEIVANNSGGTAFGGQVTFATQLASTSTLVSFDFPTVNLPSVTTTAGTNLTSVTTNTATFNANITPNPSNVSNNTAYGYFEWGNAAGSLNSTTLISNLGNGNTSISLSSTNSNLASTTFYRAVAYNIAGVTYGNIMSFTFGGATAPSWAAAAEMPTGRFGLAAKTMNFSVLYAVGGTLTSAAGGTGLTSLTSYNPTTDTWREAAQMPTGRFGLGAGLAMGVGYNNILYAVGGRLNGSSDGLTSLTSYDPLTNVWREAAQMPTGRFGLAVGALVPGSLNNNVLYAVGGTLTSAAGGTGLTSLTSYNPMTNTWVEAAQMPTGRFDLAVGVINNVLYAVGGRLNGSSGGLTSLTSYNPTTNTWREAAQMSTGRFGLAVEVINNALYAVGGTLTSTAGGTGLTSLESYNQATDSWASATAMPTGRFGLALTSLNNAFYAVGGRLNGSGDGLTSLTSFKP